MSFRGLLLKNVVQLHVLALTLVFCRSGLSTQLRHPQAHKYCALSSTPILCLLLNLASGFTRTSIYRVFLWLYSDISVFLQQRNGQVLSVDSIEEPSCRLWTN